MRIQKKVAGKGQHSGFAHRSSMPEVIMNVCTLSKSCVEQPSLMVNIDVCSIMTTPMREHVRLCEPAYVRQAIERGGVERFNLGIGYSSGTRDDR
jgi:hypothetical protein